MKNVIRFFSVLSVSFTLLHAQVVYQEDFSSAPTIVDFSSDRNTVGTGNELDFGEFSEKTVHGLDADGTGGNLSFSTPFQPGIMHHLIDTSGSGWVDGSYTLSFDSTITEGIVYWEVFAGSGLDTGGFRVRNAFNNNVAAAPVIDQINGGASVFRADGDLTSIGLNDYTPMESFTSGGLQSLGFDLTSANVGSAGDFILVSWSFDDSTSPNAAGVTIDNLTVTLIPEPSTLALFSIAFGSLFYFRSRKD